MIYPITLLKRVNAKLSLVSATVIIVDDLCRADEIKKKNTFVGWQVDTPSLGKQKPVLLGSACTT